MFLTDFEIIENFDPSSVMFVCSTLTHCLIYAQLFFSFLIHHWARKIHLEYSMQKTEEGEHKKWISLRRPQKQFTCSAFNVYCSIRVILKWSLAKVTVYRIKNEAKLIDFDNSDAKYYLNQWITEHFIWNSIVIAWAMFRVYEHTRTMTSWI